MRMDRSRPSQAADGPGRPRLFGFARVNIALLAAAVVAVFLGYWLLNSGSTTAAPLLLFAGYAILTPMGLIWGLRDRDGEDGNGGE